MRLFLQHAQAVGQRRHAVPAQFHVVVQSAANDVQVRVVQAGNDAAALEVDDLRVRAAFVILRVVHADDAAILDGEIRGFGIVWVERGDASVVENEVGSGVRVHGLLSFVWDCGCSQRWSSRVTSGITTQVSNATTTGVEDGVAQDEMPFADERAERQIQNHRQREDAEERGDGHLPSWRRIVRRTKPRFESMQLAIASMSSLSVNGSHFSSHALNIGDA